MPDSYDGSPKTVEQLKQNIARSGIVGSLVANNFKSSMIFVPLLDKEPSTGKRIDYHGLSKVLEGKIRDKYELAKSLEKVRDGEGDAEDQGARDRLRQAGGRPDRRPDQGDDVLRHRRGDRHRHHLRLHPLRAQHRAGDRLLDRGGDLAARAGGAVRLRARSLLDSGAVPGVRDRRVARRAEDERHHAGHRPRHAQAGGRALHLPAPVPGRADRAAGRRGGLRAC